MTGAGVYVASKAFHGLMWREWRDAGIPIVSTWIDESDEGATADWADLWTRCVDEAAGCAVLLVYAEPGEVLKGALVEVGAALAAGRKVIVCGDVSHSWVTHPGVLFVYPGGNVDAAIRKAAEIARQETR